MKVEELKKILEKYPNEMEVLLSIDGEGNEFIPLDTVEEYDEIPWEIFGCKQKFWNLPADFTKKPSIVLFPLG